MRFGIVVSKFTKGTVLGTLSISLGLFVLGYWLLIPQLPVTGDNGYHGDEGRWIAAGDYYFQQFFVERDWSYSTWSDDRFGPFGTRNPVVGKYIIGASLYLHGVGGRYTTLPTYDFQHDFAWNITQGNVPPIDELVAARCPIAWMGIFSGVLVFLLARELSSSWLIGLCAAVLFIFDPLVLYSSHRAMVDIPALFFSLIALRMALEMYTNICSGRQRQAMLWSLGLGISCGLSVGTKLNASLIIVVCGLWGVANLIWLYSERCVIPTSRHRVVETIKVYLNCLSRALRQDKRPVWHTVTSVALFTLIAMAIFLALNPFLYPHPIQNTWHLIEFGQIVADYEVPADQRLETWAQRWSNLFEAGLKRSGVFKRWFEWPWIDKILVYLGMLMCVRMIAQQGQKSALRRNLAWFMIWFAVEMAGILYWTPFDWWRWYLPLEPCWAILEGNGIALMLVEGWQAYRRIGHLRASARS